jgi:thymidylate kinase
LDVFTRIIKPRLTALEVPHHLQKQGFDAVYTTEPSRGELGKFIRSSAVLEGKKRVPRVVEALLFALDRVEHLEKDVKPALKKGKIVIVVAVGLVVFYFRKRRQKA